MTPDPQATAGPGVTAARLPVPTARLALVAAGAAVLLLVVATPGWVAVAVVAAALLALLATDAALAPGPRQVTAARTHPPTVTLHATAALTWTVRNDGTRPARVAVADALAPSLGAATRRFAATVPAFATATATTTMTPRRRGAFRPATMTVRVTGPLGLGARQWTRAERTDLRVLPVFRSRSDAETTLARARVQEIGLRTARGRGGGTEFDHLREYGPDDEFRRIDWAATARTGRATVRAYRAERNQTVVVLLDNGRVMAGTVDGAPRVEHGMDATMALTTVATGLGDRVGLVVFDRAVRSVLAPSARRSQLAVVTDVLCEVEPELAESDYRGALVETVARFRRRTLLVVVSDLTEAAVEEGLLPALPVALRHHLVVVAGVRDPAVVAMAEGTADGPDGPYLRAAAVEWIEQRRRAAARLEAVGATVVDAPPADLPRLLCETYLRAKATGRL
jgi:uncharacterized protein (DUF58 family)